MTADELTGTLQSRGQEEGANYAVIDNERFSVPDYVLPFLSRVKDGEEVKFLVMQDQKGKRLTKIMRKNSSKPQPAAVEPAKIPPPTLHHIKVIKVNEVAIKYNNLSPDPRISGIRIISLTPATFGMFTDAGIKEGDEIDILIDAQGMVTLPTTEFKTAKDIHLQENLDRMNGPADGETAEPPGGELIKAPATAPETDTVALQGKPITTSDKDRAYRWDLTIGGTVNLQNYENLKLEISGPACDRDQMIAYLDETLLRFGRNNPAVKDMIDAWRKKVLPGVQT